jgi:DNA invertase Pin-like site-specific DNA recombinase
VDLVVLDQAIDTTTTLAWRLLFHVLAAIAEVERDLIRGRVIAGVRGPRRRAWDSDAHELTTWMPR